MFRMEDLKLRFGISSSKSHWGFRKIQVPPLQDQLHSPCSLSSARVHLESLDMRMSWSNSIEAATRVVVLLVSNRFASKAIKSPKCNWSEQSSYKRHLMSLALVEKPWIVADTPQWLGLGILFRLATEHEFTQHRGQSEASSFRSRIWRKLLECWSSAVASAVHRTLYSVHSKRKMHFQAEHVCTCWPFHVFLMELCSMLFDGVHVFPKWQRSCRLCMWEMQGISLHQAVPVFYEKQDVATRRKHVFCAQSSISGI